MALHIAVAAGTTKPLDRFQAEKPPAVPPYLKLLLAIVMIVREEWHLPFDPGQQSLEQVRGNRESPEQFQESVPGRRRTLGINQGLLNSKS